jgi:hypothetical protein
MNMKTVTEYLAVLDKAAADFAASMKAQTRIGLVVWKKKDWHDGVIVWHDAKEPLAELEQLIENAGEPIGLFFFADDAPLDSEKFGSDRLFAKHGFAWSLLGEHSSDPIRASILTRICFNFATE